MPAAGVAGFAFAAFAVSWAWLNYSWFASAYDTDDWLFRLATMVQMIGVVVLSLGLPQLFASIDHGDTPDNHVVVAGYVVMRTALVFLWWQVSRHDPERRRTARSYMTLVGVAQVGWVALAIAGHPGRPRRSRGRRPDRVRARRPVHRRAQGQDAMAPPPHRRALWPAGDHHAGRGHHRHRRRAERARPRRGRLDASTPRCWPSPASGSRSGAGGCTSRCPGPSRWSPTASARSSSATGTS